MGGDSGHMNVPSSSPRTQPPQHRRAEILLPPLPLRPLAPGGLGEGEHAHRVLPVVHAHLRAWGLMRRPGKLEMQRDTRDDLRSSVQMLTSSGPIH